MKKLATLIGGVAAVATLSMGAQAQTLEQVKNRGSLNCGVSTGLPGFSSTDSAGNWQGLDADGCRAIAAAVLGNANSVSFVPLTAVERFTALQSGEIDVLVRNTTWTLTRDASLGLNFTGVNYYDGQGFLVSTDLGVSSALELDGAAVCIQSGTTTELNLADYFRFNGMSYEPVLYDTSEQTISGFEAGRCDVLTTDQSGLYGLRLQLSNPAGAMVLPEVISKEPLGPVVRQGDDNWFNVVKWVHYAQLNAEEMGITMANVDEMRTSNNPEVVRLLNSNEMGAHLNLDANWAYNIVKQVGNYGEMFERTVGMGSPLQIDRGINALWVDGGLQYGMPVR
ncbi:transporter substrate-binding domain-containing protein [Salinispirillum sp. LH 10-3-1]|uniref:Transporter substrate-binding domain-containing protein n=1 Tax=Salinispirillum sp. LH 10-3-1 TaxID=2952525 RepID=A0AB38YJH1_9GAMM